MQFTEFRRSQARPLRATSSSTGQLARDQVPRPLDEIVAMSRRRTEQLQGIVRSEVQRQLGSVGLATQADLRRLERKLNAAVKKSAKLAAKQATKSTKASTAKAAKRAGAKKAG